MSTDETLILRSFNNEIEATMAQEKLEQAGIYSFVENPNTTGLTPLGGTVLKIFLKDKMQAEEILADETLGQ
ncbi:hypothetical protein CNR22_16960 [Sphingobacteriaceae bacterium]|nr:hypothetical protein CNR22_16960 [Sphingobacteriaceae bacterium]